MIMKKILFIIVLSSNMLLPIDKVLLEFYAPIATSFTIVNAVENVEAPYDNSTPRLTFEIGAFMNTSMFFKLEPVNVMTGIDIGYYKDVFAYITKLGGRNTSTFDSLLLGITTKVNYDFLYAGLSIGTKIPLLASTSYGFNLDKFFAHQLDLRYKNIVVPYIKLSLDFLVIYNVLLGLYLSYDLPVIIDKYTEPDSTLSAIDVGIQAGVRFTLYNPNNIDDVRIVNRTVENDK